MVMDKGGHLVLTSESHAVNIFSLSSHYYHTLSPVAKEGLLLLLLAKTNKSTEL